MRWMFTPGVSSGTSTMLCRAWGAASGFERPMKMASRASGWPRPVAHHLRPLITNSLPSSAIVACMLVASEEATSGSVMQNTERILPASSGVSHSAFWVSLPK